jgi:hypothetical protein
VLSHLTKTTMETTVGTPTTELTTTMAPPVTTVQEMMAATAAVVVVLASMYQPVKSALGAIGLSFVMTPFYE